MATRRAISGELYFGTIMIGAPALFFWTCLRRFGMDITIGSMIDRNAGTAART
jgi:hypothetical protein